MKGMDLTKLIEGLLVVILIAIVIGKYGALQDFARREAIVSLRGWGTHAFFPAEYRRFMRGPAPGRNHLGAAPHTVTASRPGQFRPNH
jgi:hypothetical protein